MQATWKLPRNKKNIEKRDRKMKNGKKSNNDNKYF